METRPGLGGGIRLIMTKFKGHIPGVEKAAGRTPVPWLAPFPLQSLPYKRHRGCGRTHSTARRSE